jgi:enediyne biosynthesis protein E4
MTATRRPLVARFVAGTLLGVAAPLAAVAVVDARSEPLPPPALAAPRFVEEHAAAGVDQVYDGELHGFVGGGVAAFDCDGDGRPELYLAGHDRPAGLFRNVSPVGGPLRFERQADAATDLTEVTGAYPLDIDGDGHLDLAVLRRGENVLLRGLGDCRFERANERWSFDGGEAWTTAFSATFEAGAAWPTLAFGNYLDADDTERARCVPSVLIRPLAADPPPAPAHEDGPLRPEPGFAAPLDLEPAYCTLSLLFSDWDRSGRRDLRVSNDRHYHRDAEEQLWRVEPDRPPRPYTREDGWQRLQLWGMGIASHDLTGDGFPEVFLTSQGDNKLQTLASDGESVTAPAAGPSSDAALGAGDGRPPHYLDIAIERGVTAHRPHAGGEVLPSTAWHPEFRDVNNDGYVDLFITKGNVEVMPEFASADPNNLLLGQPDDTFVERAEEAGLLSFGRSRGAALVDLDLDGLVDLVEVVRGEPVRLWRNVGWGTASRSQPTGNWLAVRLRQDDPNRDGIGAWLEVRSAGRTSWHETTVGGGHAGGQLGWLHVGLGDEVQAEIRVHWPDGDASRWQAVDANQFTVVDRAADAALVWVPD